MKTKLFIAAVLVVAAFGGLGWYLSRLPGDGVACTMEAKQCPDGSYVGRVGPNCEFAPCPTAGATPAMRSVLLFYYNPELDKDASGNIQCSAQGAIPVSRQIPVTQTPIQDTIRLLLRGELTAAERAQGITTEFPLDGVALVGANLKGGVLTLEFSDPNNRTGGGSCRVAILWAQIENTAIQFPGVQQVRFIPEELFQP